MRGSSGRSVTSTRRWPLCGSRSSGRQSRSQSAGKRALWPSSQTTVSESGIDCTAVIACASGMNLPDSLEQAALVSVKDRGGERRSATHECQRNEYAAPAEGHGQPRDAVASERASQVSHAIDDTRSGRAGPQPAEVEREGSAEIGVGTEQAEGDQADQRDREPGGVRAPRKQREREKSCGGRRQPGE